MVSCRHRSTAKQMRRGGISAIVLFSSLIVASIGLASLQLMRLQGRSAEESADFIAARVHARTALEIGMLKIRNDSFWRTHLGNGDWVSDQAIGNGSFSLSAIDPIDNDVTIGDNHPIILTGTGRQADALFRTSVRLEVGPRTGSCLEVSMISGDDLEIFDATLTSDQTVCANDDVDAGGSSIVNANVEAYESVNGSTYTKSTQRRSTQRDMPDPLHAMDYYLAQGTTIHYSALRTWPQPQILKNTTFETDTQHWYANGNCTLQRSGAQDKNGNYSLRVTARSDSAAVAAQNLSLDSLRSGDAYQVSLHVFPTANAQAQAVVTLESSDSGTQTFTTPLTALEINKWGRLVGTITPVWSGTLTQATVSVAINNANDYYMDSVSLDNTTYPSGSYVLDGLLSPAHNPFGGGTNAKGIYIIDCAGKDVQVGRSRIVGTLVFLNPGGDAIVKGPLVWEPAVLNYPALLTNDTLRIGLASAGFNESDVGTNLNPPETPYPMNGGTSNSTFSNTDSYPSKIAGLVYSSKDLKFSATSNITGVVIAQEDIKVEATSLNLSYNSIYVNDPPPGFDADTVTMKVIPGTWQRTVN
ncbi:Carbohydrate binding domain protein [Novipirellula galeiformis]|uniref:Carbohydrate binding domain protein n=2 Tax=Novipirellula galeiformis TaxID=2528004 RepID=A0A5C6C8R4_9BACT|nr:Carbohydrate binding domain protein [Novipirellula galeiformis]